MGRKRAPGLRNRGGIWHIEKQVLGHKIHESTGTSDLKAAELILARRIEETRQAKIFGVRPRRAFREAAAKFLEENLEAAQNTSQWILTQYHNPAWPAVYVPANSKAWVPLFEKYKVDVAIECDGHVIKRTVPRSTML